MWRCRWLRISPPSSLLEVAEDLIKILFVNLRKRYILGVILANVETDNKGNYFGETHYWERRKNRATPTATSRKKRLTRIRVGSMKIHSGRIM